MQNENCKLARELEGSMSDLDGAKPLTKKEFERLCGQARDGAEGGDESSLLYSLCRVMMEDLGNRELTCPPASADTTALMDVVLCDYLVHRYERENSFDPFPVIQSCLFGEGASGTPRLKK